MIIYIGFIMLNIWILHLYYEDILFITINLYQKQITQKVGKYLDSKKLMLDEWLKSVKEGRRGDILCVYLLSMATGTHTAVHLSNNRVWSTLEVMPTSHDDLMRQCNKHLVYLGLGVFLQLKEHATVNILGTVTGQDPKTHKLLVASVTQSIKQEKHKGGNTNVYPKKHVTAAVGSAAQLDRVGKELMTTVVLTGTTNTSATSKMDRQMNEVGSSNSAGKPMVNILPFEVRLVRLTQQEILKYTRKCLPSEIPQSGSGRSSPIRTRSMRFRPLSTHSKKCTISGRPTQRLISKTSTFTIWGHNLCRCKQKLSLKCRIKGCTLA